MRRWWLIGAVVLVVVAGAGVVVGSCCGDWGPDRGDAVTRMVAADGTETIVVREDRHVFPFGLFIFPLFIFGLAMFFRATAFRGAWGGRGPWTPGGPLAGSGPGWLEEWHRRAHAEDAPSRGEQTP